MKTTLESLPVAQPPAAAPKEAERLQLLTLVQQFEGMLLTEMMRDVRADDDDEDDGSFGFGASAMNATMQGEFGMAMSRAGGLGMGDLLAKALARQQDLRSSPLAAAGITPASLVAIGVPADVAARALESVTDPTALAARPPTGSAALAVSATAITVPATAGDAVTVPPAAVTSAFGWRSDPIDGQIECLTVLLGGGADTAHLADVLQ